MRPNVRPKTSSQSGFDMRLCKRITKQLSNKIPYCSPRIIRLNSQVWTNFTKNMKRITLLTSKINQKKKDNASQILLKQSHPPKNIAFENFMKELLTHNPRAAKMMGSFKYYNTRYSTQLIEPADLSRTTRNENFNGMDARIKYTNFPNINKKVFFGIAEDKPFTINRNKSILFKNAIIKELMAQ